MKKKETHYIKIGNATTETDIKLHRRNWWERVDLELSAVLKYRAGKSSGPAGEITSLIGELNYFGEPKAIYHPAWLFSAAVFRARQRKEIMKRARIIRKVLFARACVSMHVWSAINPSQFTPRRLASPQIRGPQIDDNPSIDMYICVRREFSTLL